MKTSLLAFATALTFIAAPVLAADTLNSPAHKTPLTTTRAAKCNTPAGKANKKLCASSAAAKSTAQH